MDGPTRRLKIRHTTSYSYTSPVQRSEHWLHLRPIQDWRQHLISNRIVVTPDVEVVHYEDVFGNWTSRFVVDQPYEELKIVAESVVDVRDPEPFAFAKQAIQRPKFPIAWMPWERTMLSPYLMPDELANTQLRELNDYAMSFVTANKGDIMETLFNINLEMYRNYRYEPGSTNFVTSAFDVMSCRRGVCQDFANLFITMARLLNIPARYVCGYIYTGNTGGASRASSDASHAWVQLYIPDIGWKGFDPTNGSLPQMDHVRTAVGRHYRDTAPTSGTLFGGGGCEKMKVDVEVDDVSAPIEPVQRIPTPVQEVVLT